MGPKNHSIISKIEELMHHALNGDFLERRSNLLESGKGYFTGGIRASLVYKLPKLCTNILICNDNIRLPIISAEIEKI